eukprot:TRINITY_DN18959_c0_g1_i1.p1 TRINITY_DN18959_c0_g1~~TRINITY_DN18959_c0_g1_i1.p1  ORF type:complete len:178 (+),score=45.63 TRINITY_DN18959_c0_g1_i1:53-535(+)
MPLSHERGSTSTAGRLESVSAAENSRYRALAQARNTFNGPVFVDDGIHTTKVGEAVDVAAAPRPTWDPVSKRWVQQGAIADHRQFMNWYLSDQPQQGAPPGASAAHGFPGAAPEMKPGYDMPGVTCRSSPQRIHSRQHQALALPAVPGAQPPRASAGSPR